MLGADPPQGEWIADFGVDVTVQGDRRCITGLLDKIAQAARPPAIGVAEVADSYPEEIFQLLLRGEDFLFGLGRLNRCKHRMRERMRADFLTGRNPVAHFGGIHERVRRFAMVPNVPMVRSTDRIGHKKLGGSESVTRQHGQSVAKRPCGSHHQRKARFDCGWDGKNHSTSRVKWSESRHV